MGHDRSLGDALGDIASAIESGINKSDGGKQGTQSTRLWVRFYSDQGFDGIVDHTGSPQKAESSPISNPFADPEPTESNDLDFKIIGFSWDKKFGAAGSWTLTVKPSNGQGDLLNLWEDPEDVWVRIAVVVNGITTDTAYGPMNTISEALSRGQKGERNLTYTMTGQDFHKVFERFGMWVNIHERKGALPMVPMYDAMSPKLTGTPMTICRTIIDTWLGNNGIADKQWKMPLSAQVSMQSAGVYFYDQLHLAFDAPNKAEQGYSYEPSLYDPEQYMGKSLWDSLSDNCNPMLNEMFTRIKLEEFASEIPPVPELVLRQRPFPTKKDHHAWVSLPTHEIGTQDIEGRNMTKGAPESRYNYWLLEVTGLFGSNFADVATIQDATSESTGLPGSMPVYNTEDTRRHGFRKFNQTTKYLPWKADTSWAALAGDWMRILHDWYSVAPYEINGSIKTNKMFPRVQIGTRLRETRPNGKTVTYYVEGVNHSWNFPGPGKSTFQLTRGEHEGKDLLERVYDSLGLNQSSLEVMANITAHLGQLGKNFDMEQAATDAEAAAIEKYMTQGLEPDEDDPAVLLAMTPDESVENVKPIEQEYLESRGIATSVGASTGANQEEPAENTGLPSKNISEETRARLGEPSPKPEPGRVTKHELESGEPIRTSTQAVPEERVKRTARDEELDRKEAARRRRLRGRGDLII